MNLIYKAFVKIWSTLLFLFQQVIVRLYLKCNKATYSSLTTRGLPYIMVASKAKGLKIGKNLSMNNGLKHNPIGCPQRCTLWVGEDASLTIGDNVGISQTALISHCEITIGNNVKIGGGTCIYTTDFHSLDAKIRCSSEDMNHRKCAPVHIHDNVFIGAHSVILKGVTIGENSIIGAGSVVTKSVPANQIWAGNPAKLIREI